jgi:hypothetical protein
MTPELTIETGLCDNEISRKMTKNLKFLHISGEAKRA